MSFSREVKKELARHIPGKLCCRMAELSALVRFRGSLHLGGEGSISLSLDCDNAAISRKIIKLLKGTFNLTPELMVGKEQKLQKRNRYLILIQNQQSLPQALNELGILDDRFFLTGGILPREIKQSCCAISYLRGAFLGGGYLSSPEKEHHLEISSPSEELIADLMKLLARFSLPASSYRKKDKEVLYLKDMDKILSFLALIGAHRTILGFEDVRIIKEIKNEVNRLVNCDTANVKRTVLAAQRQIEEIRKIDGTLGLNKIPPGLREVALTRLRNPEASIVEIGQMLNHPASKSAVNHRFRRIRQIAGGLWEVR
jgi:DNA-binding protein WhiA